MFHGSFVPLITPFKDGHIDQPALVHLIGWQIEQGSHGLLACGTTGEFLMLSPQERQQVIDICVREVSGQIPVVAGTGALTTAETITLTHQAQKLGVDAALILTPFYVQPSQQALIHHYKVISQAIDLPILLYNNSGQSGTRLETQAILELATHSNIVGLKDRDLFTATQIRKSEPNFALFSGSDRIIPGYLAHGGSGFIAGAANLVPKLYADLYNAWSTGHQQAALELYNQCLKLCQELYIDSIPSVIKYAAFQMGLCQNEVRNPLLPVEPETAKRIQAVLEKLNLIGPRGQVVGL